MTIAKKIFCSNEFDARQQVLASVLNEKEIHYARNATLRSA